MVKNITAERRSIMPVRVRSGPLLRWGLAAVLAALLVVVMSAGGIVAEDKDVPRGPHGAATMEYQQKALDNVLKPGDVTQSPPEFDAVIWQAFIPEGNEMTAQRVALGKKLYFDPRLSKDGTVACATCHEMLPQR
jgi:cytochrome c peroxidase